jgi:hypothetical protein
MKPNASQHRQRRQSQLRRPRRQRGANNRTIPLLSLRWFFSCLLAFTLTSQVSCNWQGEVNRNPSTLSNKYDSCQDGRPSERTSGQRNVEMDLRSR